jgi:hypothetical protein
MPMRACTKKRAGRLSPAPKIVSTLFPLSGFDVDWRATLLDARQGSSRDLDHQTRLSRSALALVDHLMEFVTHFSNECSNNGHLPK